METKEQNKQNEPIIFMCPSCGRIFDKTCLYVKHNDGRRTKIYCLACAKHIQVNYLK